MEVGSWPTCCYTPPVLSPLRSYLAPLCLLAVAAAGCAEDDAVTTGDDAYLKNAENSAPNLQGDLRITLARVARSM